MNFKIGLCSNWDYSLYNYIEQAKLPNFDIVISSAEVGVRKPNPQIFQMTCDKLKVDPEDAIFIGDNWKTDIIGSIWSRLLPVWININKKRNPIRHIVVDYNNLEELYQEIWKNT